MLKKGRRVISVNYKKYRRLYFDVPITERNWPKREIKEAPIWCSVDLRDGNQSLYSPMSLEEKLDFFKLLLEIGFKEIEVGFPAASDTEYLFIRHLIEKNLIPDDVKIQVLTQSRPHIIEKTIESIRGAKNVIMHFYNSTSPLQRKVVFGKSKEEILELAVSGAKMIKDLCEKLDSNVTYEYSPESFSGTEMEYAAEICNAVIDVFEPTPEHKMIINLPATIELSTVNVYADQVEYMSKNLKRRDSIIISVHTHNDRGTGVASSELALLAGAARVEGTLLGNGERTGNADISTIALNMFSVGIDPKLKLNNADKLAAAYKKFNKLPISPRHPYLGELAYTAFSGSHQDAIKKSMDYFHKNGAEYWSNPYLTIDPTDIGRAYEPIIINSQSGKGGLSYVLENKYGYSVPKEMLSEFSGKITLISDRRHGILEPEEILDTFKSEYVNLNEKINIIDYNYSVKNNISTITGQVKLMGITQDIKAEGNGPLDALCRGLRTLLQNKIEIISYNEHALEGSSSSAAASYIAISDGAGNIYWGAGIHPNINTSSFYALISAINRMI